VLRYIHKFDPDIYVISEAVRVYRILDSLIPSGEGFLHKCNYQQISSLRGWKGSIATYEEDWPLGKRRNFTLRVSYDTNKKGRIVIEIKSIDESLEKILAA
jgi:hypothetical protein